MQIFEILESAIGLSTKDIVIIFLAVVIGGLMTAVITTELMYRTEKDNKNKNDLKENDQNG